MLNELYQVLSPALGPYNKQGTNNKQPWQYLRGLEVFIGLLSPRTQLDVIHSGDWIFHLMIDVQLGLSIHRYLVTLFRFLSNMYTFYEVSTVVGFHTIPQMILRFSYLSPYFLPYPHASPSLYHFKYFSVGLWQKSSSCLETLKLL